VAIAARRAIPTYQIATADVTRLATASSILTSKTSSREIITHYSGSSQCIKRALQTGRMASTERILCLNIKRQTIISPNNIILYLYAYGIVAVAVAETT